MKALRGVNLGGWLILEKWMTPGIFEGTVAQDEYTFMQTAGARAKLRDHHKNFIREEDFKWMAENGVEIIRIPVGYWVLDGDSPFVSCVGRLDWAFTMAQKYNLEVLLCLHAAPGNQNGRDHSGRIGQARWYKDIHYRQQTVSILRKLAERYRDNPKFWGLELLNEPKFGLLHLKLRRFYNTAYRELSLLLLPHTRIVFHDAFTPRLLSTAIRVNDVQRVTMDMHWYHFTFWAHKGMPLAAYYKYIVGWHGRLITNLRRWQGVVVGEWNGIIAGAMLDKYPQKDHEVIIAEHIRRQQTAYDNADAWFYWSYKTERRGVWHFRSMVEDGLIDLR